MLFLLYHQKCIWITWMDSEGPDWKLWLIEIKENLVMKQIAVHSMHKSNLFGIKWARSITLYGFNPYRVFFFIIH